MKKLMTILIISLAVILSGCSETDDSKDIEEITAKVETLLAERYGEYFDEKSFGCGDYLIDGNVYMATVFSVTFFYDDSELSREEASKLISFGNAMNERDLHGSFHYPAGDNMSEDFRFEENFTENEIMTRIDN